MTVELAGRYQSVLGGIGLIRLLMCGEGILANIYPNVREGLCIPMANAIAEKGGTVWRGEGCRGPDRERSGVSGERMQDGREARAPIVALAVGNPRIPALLDPLPPEVKEAVDYSAEIDMQDFNIWYLLKEPAIAPPRGSPSPASRSCWGTPRCLPRRSSASVAARRSTSGSLSSANNTIPGSPLRSRRPCERNTSTAGSDPSALDPGFRGPSTRSRDFGSLEMAQGPALASGRKPPRAVACSEPGQSSRRRPVEYPLAQSSICSSICRGSPARKSSPPSSEAIRAGAGVTSLTLIF